MEQLKYRFPVTVVDGFYKNPKEIVKLANTMEYYNESGGMWPGVRTAPLNEINDEFYQYCANKFLSVFFDFSLIHADFEMTIQFQKIKSHDKDYLNEGWIHMDNRLCAGLVYLDENPTPNAGTSIYEPIDDEVTYDGLEDKSLLYEKGIESPSYKENNIKHNSQFRESVKVANQFNRLIAYDGDYPHKATGHGTKHGERLTQTFFVKSLGTSRGCWHQQRFEGMESIGERNLTDCI